jgi:hypothetical protein
VIAGHFHRDELHVIDGLPFYLAGPVINFWGRQSSYRHWTLASGILSYRTVYLDLETRSLNFHPSSRGEVFEGQSGQSPDANGRVEREGAAHE